MLNLDALPDIADEECAAAAQLIVEARARLLPEQRWHVREHLLNTSPDMPETTVEQEVTARLHRAEQGILDTDHPLYFDNGQMVLARQVTAKMHGWTLADPAEPEEGRGKAKLYWRAGAWRVVSWAHGVKRVYRLIQPGCVEHDPWLGDRRQWHGIPLAVRRVAP